MITVVTPFSRRQNLELLANVLKDKAHWIVLIDDESLRPLFPEWVTVKHYELPKKVDPAFKYAFVPSNKLFNNFIADGLDPEMQYMILCDDDSVEEGFFDKIPNEDVVCVSMKRGDHPVMGSYCAYPTNTLIAHPDNMHIGQVAGEQLIIKGKILRNFRYGQSAVGDGEMVMKVIAEHPVTFVPDAYVLFNYFEDGRYDSFSRKPIVLFIGDYYCAANPAMGLSEWEGNIWASLESTKMVDIARFHMDKYFYATGQRGDTTLLERIDQIRPNYVVLIMYKPFGQDQSVILEETLKVIAHHKKIPVISIWGDLEIEDQRNISATIKPYAWKMIGTANKEITERLGYIYLHVPKDPRVFNNPNKERDIDVVFSGSFGYGRNDRREVLQYLLDNGIKLLAGGSEGGEHLSVEEYADRYKRAKITISFSRVAGTDVVNARPFEAMLCGALVMNQESEEMAKLYDPYLDYIPWESKKDLLTKIQNVLNGGNTLSSVASSGQKRTEERYSAKTFWEKAFENMTTETEQFVAGFLKDKGYKVSLVSIKDPLDTIDAANEVNVVTELRIKAKK